MCKADGQCLRYDGTETCNRTCTVAPLLSMVQAFVVDSLPAVLLLWLLTTLKCSQWFSLLKSFRRTRNQKGSTMLKSMDVLKYKPTWMLTTSHWSKWRLLQQHSYACCLLQGERVRWFCSFCRCDLCVRAPVSVCVHIRTVAEPGKEASAFLKRFSFRPRPGCARARRTVRRAGTLPPLVIIRLRRVLGGLPVGLAMLKGGAAVTVGLASQ